MKISCPTCSAKYSIADEKVQSRLAKIRCRKCGTSIVIDGNVSPANVYAADAGAASAEPEQPAAAAPATPAAPAEAPSGTTYTVDLGENDQRQMTVAELVESYNSGVVTAETYVWTDGFADWAALGQVEEIVEALHAAAHADAPTAPVDEASAVGASTQPDESPWDAQPAAPAAQPSLPSAPASPAAPATGGGADLFGNVSDAGRESESAGGVKTGSSPLGGGSPEATGARNESSVLFSLSALTSGASNSRPSVPAPSAPSTTNEDSGLIDLRALTAAAEATSGAPGAPSPNAPMPMAAQSPLGGPSPLGGASPLGAPVGASMPPSSRQKNNTGLYIAVGIVVAAVAVASIITFGGSDEQPVAPPVPAATAAAAPTPEPAPVPTAAPAPLPTAEAKPPSTGTEEDEEAPEKPAASPKPQSRPTSSPKPAPQASPSPAPSPAPQPAPKPSSSGKCGCAADDLMCLMNCAK